MADIFSARASMRASKAKLDAATTQLNFLENELEQDIGELPAAALAALRKKVTAQASVVRAAQANYNAWVADYQAAVAADSMSAVDPGLPLVLLPIRIETAYLPTDAGQDLVVRVYPDDIHVDTHEPELTAAELAAGTVYWQAVWGAGANQARLDAAWAAILSVLKPARAAWAVRALLPDVPRPDEETPIDQPQPNPPLANPAARTGTFNRPARTTLLPDYWRVIGLRSDNTELFYAEGSPIPDSLDLSFGPPGMDPPDPEADLPFQAGSLWLVDLDTAIAAGMALRIPLAGPDFSVGQLFVMGVSSSLSPDDAAARLESALIAHQYTNGLGFLPPGTPTNNTAQTKSAWQSAPPVPTPTDLDNARANYQPGSNQNAAVAASTFGIDGTESLSVAPNALVDQQSDIATIQQFLWTALAGKSLSWLYTRWIIPAGGVPTQGSWRTTIDFPFVQALQNHVGQWVRSRGKLPVIRIGNQPYGLLPALSLDDWVTPDGDPLSNLITWLRTLRSYWFASIGTSASVPVGADPDADSTVVNILQRLPVSADIEVRTEADPVYQAIGTLPVAPIPGLPTTSEYFLAVPSNSTQPLPVDVVHDAAGDQVVLVNYQQLFHDGLAVLEQQPGSTADAFRAKYQDLIGSNSFPGSPPPDLFISLIQDAFTDPLIVGNVNNLNSLAGFIICGAMFFDPANAQLMQTVEQFLPAAQTFAAQFDSLCNTNPANREAAIRETLDVFSHRLDAWITSLAARRLDEMRAAKPKGLVLGACGWVENLAPRSNVPDQTYIHAPSIGHATTAAVLRSGYDSHGGSGPLAVNLVSSRVRKADWLAAGIRSGQTLGALLGYRFERGLHDAQLDRLIAPLRIKYPLPLPTGPDADANGQAALEAITARNVVDGLALSKNKDSVPGQVGLVGDDATTVAALLDELADVIDSFGDLLLAESVHHLVGGNPLRAGLTADTAGRGEPVPDRFDVTFTPRSSRPLTWQLGALLPVDFRSTATGWQIDRPRAAAEPHVDAWVATILGNADSWQISCSLTTEAGVSPIAITLADVGVSALDVVAESAGGPSQLELRIVEAVSGGLPDGTSVSVSRNPNPDGTPGFGELLSLALRIRNALGKATPLGPQHLQGPATSSTAGIDLGDLDTRAAALGASLNAATSTLQNAAEALDAAAGSDDATILAAVQTIRAAFIAVADHGVPAAWPAVGASTAASSVSVLSAQASSLLAALQPLATTVQPTLPDVNADGAAVAAWLGAITEYVHGIIGSSIPLLAAYVLPADFTYAMAFAAGATPTGADAAGVMTWLRRISRIRKNAAMLHDLLLGAEAFQGAPVNLTVAQLPGEPGARWAALPFPDSTPPVARLSLVLSTPTPIDPASAFCGFICDTWTELLPGVTSVASGDRNYEASEVTGMAFKVDTPAAAAPQCLLVAVPPDLLRPWSPDILFDTVKETFEMAKIRPVDLGDLVRFCRVLPAIHSSSNVDQTLSDALKQQPVAHP